MAMRITTSMVQRNILADLNGISTKLTKSQMKAASNKEISRPSDDPGNRERVRVAQAPTPDQWVLKTSSRNRRANRSYPMGRRRSWTRRT